MKILILLFIFFPGVYSVNPNSGGLDMKGKTYEILITGHQSNRKLVLQDVSGKNADTLDVNYGDLIIWTNTDPDITIIKIKENLLTRNHFKDKPTLQPTQKWKGKVDSYIDQKIHIIKYFIKWKDSEGKDDTYDPLIRINPNQVGD